MGSWMNLPLMLLPAALACGLSGCSSSWGTAAIVAGGTAIGAQAPTNEIEQIYYVGIFDPHEQLPSQVYRLTVRGQASFISQTHFASGWVPASFVDSLGSNVTVDQGGNVQINKSSEDILANLSTGRRMMLFGPEGFREAPADQRLVIVMGSDPSQFFQGIEGAMGYAAQIKASTTQPANDTPTRDMATALKAASVEQGRLQDLQDDLDSGF
jgi:hypothetical protein